MNEAVEKIRGEILAYGDGGQKEGLSHERRVDIDQDIEEFRKPMTTMNAQLMKEMEPVKQTQSDIQEIKNSIESTCL